MKIINCPFCKAETKVKKVYGKDAFNKPTYWYTSDGKTHDCEQGRYAAKLNKTMWGEVNK